MMVSGIGAELGFILRFLKLLPISSLQQLFSTQQRLVAYGHQAIQNLKDQTTSKIQSKKTVFTSMIDQEKNPDITDEALAQEAANLIVAGSDTTATSLTYTIWALLRPQNQPYRNKLLQEMKTAGPVSKLSSKDLAALPYLNAIIKEGLRLYCAAPASLPRSVPLKGTIMNGYKLPGACTVSTQAYTMHRDAQIFEDPER